MISSHYDVTNCGIMYDKVRVNGNAKMAAEAGRFKLATGYDMAIIIIIIIIKKGWEYKAGRDRLTNYQSKDPSPTIPTHRMKEEKGENRRIQKGSKLLG